MQYMYTCVYSNCNIAYHLQDGRLNSYNTITCVYYVLQLMIIQLILYNTSAYIMRYMINVFIVVIKHTTLNTANRLRAFK